MKIIGKIYFGASILMLSAAVSFGEVKVVVDHNDSSQATAQFKFRTVPSPATNNAAIKATLTIVDGEPDGSSGGLGKLNDGKLPTAEDQPGKNFFFARGSDGGRIQMDLGDVINIQRVNSYSWHSDTTRGNQAYTLYASDGKAKNFSAPPKKGTDPRKSGWKLIAKVNTQSRDGNSGAQFGVNISSTNGIVGKYRYLLFEFYRTEGDDDFGNTFYSEIDVVEKSDNAQSSATAVTESSGQVPLSPFFNVCGIYKDDAEFTGGLDDGGFACSAEQLGSAQIWNDTSFNIGPAGATNVITGTGQTIPLPSGNFSSLRMLATAVNGSQESQNFAITYTNGDTQSCTQGISDWSGTQNYPGESPAVTMAYRNQSDGTKSDESFYIYGYTFNLNKTNTVKSVTLPDNNNVKVFSLTLVP